MGTIAIALLKKFWPYLLGAALIGGGLLYLKGLHMQIDHYKKEATTQKDNAKRIAAQFNKALDDAEVREGKLALENAELTEQHRQVLTENSLLIDQHTTDLKKVIATNEELRKLKLSLNLIRLFNASKQPPGEHNEVTTNAVPGNDGKATAVVEATGNDLFTVIAINDANHLKCIATVEEWQKFWTGYVENVNRAQEP